MSTVMNQGILRGAEEELSKILMSIERDNLRALPWAKLQCITTVGPPTPLWCRAST